MRRLPLLLGLALLFLVGGLVAYLGGPAGRDEPPRVAWEVDAPKRAFLREPTVLQVRVRNVGAVPARDLGVKINRGYANVFTIADLEPRAQIDDSSTEKRLYFGPLAPGEAKSYRITFQPQRAGQFNLVLKVVAAQRGAEPLPLPDAVTGRADFNATTEVVERDR